MSKLNRLFPAGLATCGLALIAFLTMASLPASVHAEEHQGAALKTAMQPKGDIRPSTRGYELRCWQEGRLIVQENYLQAPPASGSDAMRMQDRDGRPVRVLETANATCLLKAVAKQRRIVRP